MTLRRLNLKGEQARKTKIIRLRSSSNRRRRRKVELVLLLHPLALSPKLPRRRKPTNLTKCQTTTKIRHWSKIKTIGQ